MTNQKIGLIYNTNIMGENPSWLLDSTSIETWGSSWSDFGYEIIYRVEELRTNDRILNELKTVFMKPFNLSREHYRFDPTFWRVYWDRGQWRVSLLKECEAALDKVARDNKIALILNDIVIQPRPMGYIQQELTMNKE